MCFIDRATGLNFGGLDGLEEFAALLATVVFETLSSIRLVARATVLFERSALARTFLAVLTLSIPILLHVDMADLLADLDHPAALIAPDRLLRRIGSFVRLPRYPVVIVDETHWLSLLIIITVNDAVLTCRWRQCLNFCPVTGRANAVA